MRRIVILMSFVFAGSLILGGVALAATYTGTPGPDTISGTPKSDTIRGLAGNDHLYGRSGDDHIYGGTGYDVIRGGNGDDYIGTNDGLHDTVYCGNGVDFVYADRSDTVYYGCETVKIVNP